MSSSAVKRMCFYIENSLTINEGKTKMLLFSLTDMNKSLLIKMHKKSTEQNKFVKYLGVFIDLTYSYHVDAVLTKSQFIFM